MVKRDPDDLITALSKNLKGKDAVVLKFTFKRGGLWKGEYAKAHSRKAKKAIKQTIKESCAKQDQKQWPLLVRYKENKKNKKSNKEEEVGENTEAKRLNCQIKIGKGTAFIQSMLNVFRVNFFKKKEENMQKLKNQKSKPNPVSKTSLKKKQRAVKNKERRTKLHQIQRKLKKQKRLQKLKK